MRIGLLSDVHANLPALQAGLAALRDRGVERLLVAGDLVGYGASPNECVAVLAEAGAECVAGNHDLFVLDRLPPTRFPPVARRSADLTRGLLTSDARGFLSALPLRRRVEDVLMTHGSLDDPEEYVTTEDHALSLLSRLPAESPGADTLLLGHTHLQRCVVDGVGELPADGTVPLPAARSRLLNPGSIGQSRQRERRPRARCAVYDDRSGEIEFLVVDYDVEAARAALRRHELPDRCLHAPPRLRGKVKRMALRAVERAGVRLPGR